MTNDRFADYVTSGAFAMSLTRNQISALAMMPAAGAAAWFPNAGSLERKGLVERVPNPDLHSPLQIEYRLTYAGALALSMIQQAGLTNSAVDPLAVEHAALREEIEARRTEAQQARLAARSALARKEEAEAELENARREIAELKTGRRGKLMVHLRARDPMPDVTDRHLAQMAMEPPV